jgi:hypothetical protein
MYCSTTIYIIYFILCKICVKVCGISGAMKQGCKITKVKNKRHGTMTKGLVAASAKEMISDDQWRCWQWRAKAGNGSGQGLIE